jgi:hypothetical protein
MKTIEKIISFLDDSVKVVVFFGIVVGSSLVLQCFIPFIGLMFSIYEYTGFWTTIFNNEFVLPMGVISDFWAAMCAIYVGVDRGAMVAITLTGEKGKLEVGNPEHLKQVMIESFLLYTLAVGLNIFFDADLALSPLFIAFGSTVVLFVGGNKFIRGASALAPEKDLDHDGINDDEQDPNVVLAHLKEILRASGNLADEEDLNNDGIKDAEQDAAQVLKTLKEAVNKDEQLVTVKDKQPNNKPSDSLK